MSVVGIDFGTESCVIAVAKRGAVDVVTNEVSHRKTPTLIGFNGEERLIGESGKTKLRTNVKNTVTEIKRIIGRPFSSEDLQKDMPNFNFRVHRSAEGGVQIEVKYMDKDVRFQPEQILAAILTNLRAITQTHFENLTVSDCVISVPPFFTNRQRIAVLDSARIASLNVLRLMNETTAVALNYGILRTLPKEKIRIVFVDVGYSNTNVAVVDFVAGKLNIIGTASEKFLGGRDFDRLIIDYFCKEFLTTFKIDVKSNKKAMIRLALACEKMKRVLSANLEGRVSIDSIMEDVDVRGVMTRDTLQELAQSFIARLLPTLQRGLKVAGTTKEEITNVEIIGGCIRVPALRNALKEWFGRDPSTTCNGDESVARGCALQCAMLSPSFKVRDFDVQDVSPYGITLSWGPPSANSSDATTEDDLAVFKEGNAIPSTKLISFHKAENFQIVAKYSDPSVCPGESPVLGRYVIEVPARSPNAVNPDKVPKIKVKAKLNLHGVLELKSALRVEEVHLTEAEIEEKAKAAAKKARTKAEVEYRKAVEKRRKEIEAKKKKAEEAKKKEDAKTEGDDVVDEEIEAAPMDTSTDAEPAPASPEPDAVVEPDWDTEYDFKKYVEDVSKTRKLKTELVIRTFETGGISEADFKKFFEAEVEMINQDRVLIETAEKKNELESYIYDTKGALQGPWKPYMKDDARSKFTDELEDELNWLYEDGEDAQKSEYVAKLKALRATSEKVVKLKREHDNRDTNSAALKSSINTYFKFAASTEEQYSHISQEDRKKVSDKATEYDEWLAQTLAQQDKRAKWEDLVVTCDELRKKKKELEAFCDPIVTQAKPEPPKKKAKKKDEASTDSADAPSPAASPEPPVTDDQMDVDG